MDAKKLRKRCEQRLQELDLPTPFDLESFCTSLADRRGRPIVLQPVAGGTGPYGLWAAGPSSDVIFYEEATSPLHREHIILHEVSHLLCDHQARPVTDTDMAELLFPDLQRQTIQRVLQRGSYTTDEEREAEVLASLIVERVTNETVQRDVRHAADNVVLERIEVSLEVESDRPA